MTRADRRAVSARRSRPVLRGVAGFLLAAALAGIAAACGASADDNAMIGGETHFLRRCEPADEGCGAGLECIAGLCTRACDPNAADTCNSLAPSAECVVVLASGLGACDLACTERVDCAALGDDYACDSGRCRADRIVKPASGAGNPTDCRLYRDQNATELPVVVRNDTGAPIYIQPYHECNDPSSSLVEVDRDGDSVNIRGFGACGVYSCEDIQDNGPRGPIACPDACQPSPAMLRLEPGAEVSAGRQWLEYASHGLTPNSFLMHESCSDGAQACYAALSLFPSAYGFTARAFFALECTLDEACDCAPGPSGSCTTASMRGTGQPLSANAGIQLTDPAGPGSASPPVVLRFAATP